MAVAITLILGSCQKEIDWGTGNSGGVNQKLMQIKSQTGTDTSQVDYSYDAGNRLIRVKTAGISGGQSLDDDLVISRNSSGNITKGVQIAAALVAAGVDSIVTIYNYNASTSKYSYGISDLSIGGFSLSDSVAYTYDANGHISKDEHYIGISGSPIPIPPVLTLRDVYTYSGSNLVTIDQNAATTPGGPLTLVGTQAYTFDSKVNPLVIGDEAILLSRFDLFGANNTKQLVVISTTSPSNNVTADYTYKYNSRNKPDSSFGTRTPAGTVTAAKYYYQ